MTRCGRRSAALGRAPRQASRASEVIGQAKGILMERYKITGVEAFGLLVASSQAVNRKLRDVAEHPRNESGGAGGPPPSSRVR